MQLFQPVYPDIKDNVFQIVTWTTRVFLPQSCGWTLVRVDDHLQKISESCNRTLQIRFKSLFHSPFQSCFQVGWTVRATSDLNKIDVRVGVVGVTSPGQSGYSGGDEVTGVSPKRGHRNAGNINLEIMLYVLNKNPSLARKSWANWRRLA